MGHPLLRVLLPLLIFVGALVFVSINLTSCGSDATAMTADILVEIDGGQSAAGSNETVETVAAGSAEDDSAVVTEDSYSTSTRTITVTAFTMGSGNDKVTYYVADIQLSGGASLETAFSNGSYRSRAQDTSAMAGANDAIVAINGDYYSARDDGIIIRNGVVYQDLPVRTGLAIYLDGSMKVYDETTTTADELLAAGVWNTFSFGPGLVVDGSVVSGIESYEPDPYTRHPIEGVNPRSGVGMISPDHYVFVVVDGRSPGYSRGVTVTEFAQIFKDLGCSTAYNLDGGGSATLYFMGEVVNDPAQRNGERAVSDILFVG